MIKINRAETPTVNRPFPFLTCFDEEEEGRELLSFSSIFSYLPLSSSPMNPLLIASLCFSYGFHFHFLFSHISYLIIIQ